MATQDLAREVERYLGRAVFVSASQADVSVEGHIAKKGEGWRAEITIRDAQGTLLGTREHVQPDGACSSTKEPLALMIAMMIDPDAKLLEPKEPTPTLVTAPVFIPQPKKVEPATWRVDGMASGVGSVGLLPNIGVGATASSIIQPPNVPVALEGSGAFWFDNSVNVGGGQMTFSLLTLSGGLCPLAFHAGRLHLYGCAAGSLGLLRARSSGFTTEVPESSRFYLAGSLDARLTIRLFGPFGIRAGGSMVVPILRDRFTYKAPDGQEQLGFQMSPVALIGDLGIGIVFP